jgi:hypothetical protein
MEPKLDMNAIAKPEPTDPDDAAPRTSRTGPRHRRRSTT